MKGTGDVEDLPEELQGADRVLTKLEVFEVLPVMKGAGIDTQTVVVKNQNAAMDAASFREYVEEHKDEIGEVVREAMRTSHEDNHPAIAQLARFEQIKFERARR